MIRHLSPKAKGKIYCYEDLAFDSRKKLSKEEKEREKVKKKVKNKKKEQEKRTRKKAKGKREKRQRKIIKKEKVFVSN